jgi:sigma-B regulation protein RsbU (phosphoserine phosphatase)
LCNRGTSQIIDVETGPALGLDEDASYPIVHLDLRFGDTLLMYTDGITEAADAELQMFGIERTLQSLACVSDAGTAADHTRQLLDDVERFVVDAPQSDDITVLALRRDYGDDETTPAILDATIENRMGEAFALMDQCDALLEEFQVTPTPRQNVRLALEELLVNMVRYGQPDGRVGRIDLQLRLAAHTLIVELHDNGMPFDPLQSAPPELTGDIADQSHVGGFGIHLVRSVTHHIRYTRDAYGNHLLMRFNRFAMSDTESLP